MYSLLLLQVLLRFCSGIAQVLSKAGLWTTVGQRWANENPMVGRSRPTGLLGVVVKWDCKLQIRNNGWANGNPQQRATGGFHKYCIGKVMDGVVAFFVSLRCC